MLLALAAWHACPARSSCSSINGSAHLTCDSSRIRVAHVAKFDSAGDREEEKTWRGVYFQLRTFRADEAAGKATDATGMLASGGFASQSVRVCAGTCYDLELLVGGNASRGARADRIDLAFVDSYGSLVRRCVETAMLYVTALVHSLLWCAAGKLHGNSHFVWIRMAPYRRQTQQLSQLITSHRAKRTVVIRQTTPLAMR